MAAALGAVLRRLHTAAAQPPRLTKFALHPPKFQNFSEYTAQQLIAKSDQWAVKRLYLDDDMLG
ncbi:hypothetical protein ZEAMMB73_Zm00001d042469 [Zea mays]|uniref:Uncharacterized protein n=1 Tax=Zea mays TaxID=4577 RepID=A0A1D6N474_MAIZE|nr:hypothetical protein ZEAMMB73_Zm00001d042469 [Zea mays]